MSANLRLQDRRVPLHNSIMSQECIAEKDRCRQDEKKSHKLKRAEKCETIVFESRGGSRTLAYVDGNRIERVMPLRSYILSKSLLPVAWVDILGVDIIFLAMRVAWNFIAPSVGCCHILRAADWWFCNVPSSFLDGAFCWQAFLFSFRCVRFTTSQFNASTCSLTRDSV